MPSQLSRGQTFSDGGTGSASQFHALVDQGRILPGAISEQIAAVPGGGDSFLFHQSQSGNLKKCTLNQLITAFPRGGGANVFALRRLGTGAETAAAGNDGRFPARLNGLRKANQASPDTVATAQDLTFAAVNLTGNHTQIDWAAGDLFYDTLTANKTYTFAHVPTTKAQVITVAIKLQGHTVTWPTLLGTIPVIDASATIHYFTFIRTPLGTSATVVAL